MYTPQPELVGLNPSLARVDSVVKPFGYELLQVGPSGLVRLVQEWSRFESSAT